LEAPEIGGSFGKGIYYLDNSRDDNTGIDLRARVFSAMEKRGWLADDNGIPWFSDAKQGRGLNRSILHISWE
jgi:hypothetical protein